MITEYRTKEEQKKPVKIMLRRYMFRDGVFDMILIDELNYAPDQAVETMELLVKAED